MDPRCHDAVSMDAQTNSANTSAPPVKAQQLHDLPPLFSSPFPSTDQGGNPAEEGRIPRLLSAIRIACLPPSAPSSPPPSARGASASGSIPASSTNLTVLAGFPDTELHQAKLSALAKTLFPDGRFIKNKEASCKRPVFSSLTSPRCSAPGLASPSTPRPPDPHRLASSLLVPTMPSSHRPILPCFPHLCFMKPPLLPTCALLGSSPTAPMCLSSGRGDHVSHIFTAHPPLPPDVPERVPTSLVSCSTATAFASIWTPHRPSHLRRLFLLRHNIQIQLLILL